MAVRTGGHVPIVPKAKPNGHPPECTCETCFEPVMTWVNEGQPETQQPIPTSRAEFTAALDRAYNMGYERGREGRS